MGHRSQRPHRLRHGVRPAKKRRAREGAGAGSGRSDGYFDYELALTNCAMMNIPPSEADKLSLYRYQALLHHWNDAHDTSGEGDRPDPDVTQKLLDRINADPRLTGAALQTV
jgi:hypothetical protein